MAERSFREEVKRLRLGAGEEFRGEGILAVTKALLQSGVGYVAGYQGAPISHLMDVLSDAQDILAELGVHFESSASEATAAATLAASVNYPVRGAVTWKSTVGTNVASDALANLASGGVTGGALIVVGEDYGEGSSIMQERTHAFAMKSQIWLLDPRPNLETIVNMVEKGFELSEASSTPVMLELRIRACHVHGRFQAKDNQRPRFGVHDALAAPRRDTSRIALPPSVFAHEKEKIDRRWPAAVEFIRRHRLNEVLDGEHDDLGLIVQGGMFNTAMRALERLGLADAFGRARIPVYVMNVTYPLVDEELVGFCRDKRAVLMVEEGQPDYIEQALHAILRKAQVDTRISGKDVLPMAGEYTGDAMLGGLRGFLAKHAPGLLPAVQDHDPRARPEVAALASVVPPRPPGFCTGCPERPIFSALKLVEQEVGPLHVSCDIGCHLFSILPPFNIGQTTMGYGLGTAGASAFNVAASKPAISIMGDGGFWHNGLTSGIGNAVFNRNDGLTIVVDNGYSAATGGQDIPSSRGENPSRKLHNPIARAVSGVGVPWVRTVTRTYGVDQMRGLIREAIRTRPGAGPKVLVAQSECMLNRQRREKPALNRAIADGRRAVRERFYVDPDTCTGDHACIRLSGCPSLSIDAHPDPLRVDPVTRVDSSCVGCGLCGENAQAAILCPSFVRVRRVHNAGWLERTIARWRRRLIDRLVARGAAPAGPSAARAATTGTPAAASTQAAR
ncbi:MAG: indolepyruvate ferredoxin oxidoreductase subunit alpha [Burkholderiaceae bacterium]